MSNVQTRSKQDAMYRDILTRILAHAIQAYYELETMPQGESLEFACTRCDTRAEAFITAAAELRGNSRVHSLWHDEIRIRNVVCYHQENTLPEMMAQGRHDPFYECAKLAEEDLYGIPPE